MLTHRERLRVLSYRVPVELVACFQAFVHWEACRETLADLCEGRFEDIAPRHFFISSPGTPRRSRTAEAPDFELCHSRKTFPVISEKCVFGGSVRVTRPAATTKIASEDIGFVGCRCSLSSAGISAGFGLLPCSTSKSFIQDFSRFKAADPPSLEISFLFPNIIGTCARLL